MSQSVIPLQKPRQTQLRRRRITPTVAAALMAGLAAFTADAATNTPIAKGTMAYSEVVGGPATVLMRTLTIAPGEVLGWHAHPGAGAYTIIVSGTLTVEDGCGGETTYSQGEAFLEPPDRAHRGKNLTTSNVVTAQTFIVPAGDLTTEPHPLQACGVPKNVEECKGDGWQAFDLPREFTSQGECMEYVITGK